MIFNKHITRYCFILLTMGSLSPAFAGDGKGEDDEKETITLHELKHRFLYGNQFEKLQQPDNLFFSQKTTGEGDITGVPITFSGSFRFFGLYRVLKEHYPEVNPINLNISGFGDGSLPTGGTPFFTLNTKITPKEDIDIEVGFGLNHIFTGTSTPDSTRGRWQFSQTFGAVADFRTSIGNIKFGGGNLFTGMSQLFSGWATIRWNPFYRLPWDASTQWGGSWDSYTQTFENGSATNFDPAFAVGGRVQGVILQLSEFPGNFGLNLMYGVTGQTGLYVAENNPYQYTMTKKSLGGRLHRKMGNSIVGITGILNDGYVDNVTNLRETQYMYSTDVYLKFNQFTISAEVGATQFTNPFGKYDADSSFYDIDTLPFTSGKDLLLQARIDLDKSALGFPLRANFYHLGPNYINANSGAFNTTTYNNSAAYVQVNGEWDVAMRRGFIPNIGQSANNRRALELSTDIKKGRFNVGIATQVGTEIQKETDTRYNQVMFYHHLNSWSRASFQYWTPRAGPYQKLLSNFIQLLERVPITDSVIDYKKTFNVFNIEARYKSSIWGRSLILVNYFNYQSASDKFSPVPYFNENAFVRVLYNEFTAYYQLYEKTVILGHVAYNQAKGNYRTDLSPDNGKPIDQQTWGFGLGLDWNFATNMGLYFREMYMTHRDKNFSLDRFSGFETTMELKVMF